MEAVAHSELAKLSLDLKPLNAKPLWERTTRMGPGSPAVPAIWRYRDMRRQLLRAVELITAKEAERRVFMLENPGLPGRATSPTRSIAGFR
jgi:gentisate 1,2-dioxygenase